MKRYFYDLINNEPFAKPIHDLKYHPIQPRVYPLSDNHDISMASHHTAQWQIKQIKVSHFFLEHLILPKGHNISEYRNKDSGDDWQKYQRPLHWFECTPLLATSAISQLYFGLHGNGQISLLALIKAGVRKKVCLELSGDQGLVDSPSTPNGFVYNFAPQAGHDKRARASLMLTINNEHACQRLQAFISGISKLVPFDNQMMTFYQQVLANCRQLLINAGHEWQLPQMALAIDESIKPFVGYPNHVADPTIKKNFTYYKADILNFPATTPPLHLAICHFENGAVKALIEANPMVIFERDAFGALPIELATNLYAIDIAAEIFMAWFNLPQKQQWADAIFISCASLIDDKEVKPYLKNDSIYKQQRLKQHSHYHYLLGSQLDEDINYWQRLSALASHESSPLLAAEICKIIPDNFQLFKSLLMADMAELQVSLTDQLPNITMLWRAIDNLDWPGIERFANEPWLQENQHFQRSIAIRDIETIKQIYRQVPESIPRKLPNEYHWQHQLKKSILEKLPLQCDSISKVKALVLEEISCLLEVYTAIEALDSGTLRKHRESLYHFGFGYRQIQNPAGLNHEVFNNINCPKHLPLIIYYLQGDMVKLLQYIDKTICQLSPTLSLTMMPQRPSLHQSIIDGYMPNIDAFIEEQHFFYHFVTGLHQLFTEQYQILLHHFKEQYKTLKLWQQQKVATKKINNSWQKNLARYIKFMVVDEASYRSLDRIMQIGLAKLNKSLEELVSHQRDVEIILTIKRNIADAVSAHIAEYRPLCQAASELDFEIYTLATACLISDAVLKDLLENFKPHHSLSPIKSKLSQLKKEGHCLKRYGGLLGGNLSEPQALTSLIRQGLLSFEKQDPWGYNPLLLAIVNNDLAITRAFLQANLFTDRIWVHNDDGNYKNYHLLDHAPTEAMLELLLKHFFDPNQKHHLLDRTPDNLRLLNYGYNLQTDSHHQTVLDKLIYQQFKIDKPESLLIKLLEYQEQGVQTGPYDDDIDYNIQTILMAHNKKIARRQQQNASKAKIKSYASLTTFFSASASADDFYSEIKPIHDLTLSERQQLTDAFAARFQMREGDSVLARQRFFERHILSNCRYYIEIFKNKRTDKIAAFFCFQFRKCNYPTVGPFNLFYASLAVCIEETAQYGLLSAAFKVILMAKQISNEQGLPLKFYARLGRPGIAYLLLPKEAKVSTKYAVDRQLVDYIAYSVIGNTPEITGGSSLPPVLSAVKRSYSNWRLKEFDHLLDDLLHASEQSSLLAVCDVDEAFAAGLYQKLNKNHHISHDYITNAAEALKEQLEFESRETKARL